MLQVSAVSFKQCVTSKHEHFGCTGYSVTLRQYLGASQGRSLPHVHVGVVNSTLHVSVVVGQWLVVEQEHSNEALGLPYVTPVALVQYLPQSQAALVPHLHVLARNKAYNNTFSRC